MSFERGSHGFYSKRIEMGHIAFNKLSFLVVDDNMHMRNILRTLLMSFGSRTIYEAENGEDGIESVISNEPHIVITDWVMPVSDGAELVRLIRNPDGGAYAFTPIIMLTAYSERRRVIEARDLGVHEFMCKPVSAKALYQRIYTIVTNPRPFLRTKTYFGPDRRRGTDPDRTGADRCDEDNAEYFEEHVPRTNDSLDTEEIYV